MAKGKQAALAANRRLEAARDHIDRLTSDLADARIRARDAEIRAARLEGIDQLVTTATPRNDAMLQEALSGLKRWSRVQREDEKRRGSALTEVINKLVDDLGPGKIKMSPGSPHNYMPWMDRLDFLQLRYPALVSALTAGKYFARGDLRTKHAYAHAQRELTGEDLRRFQRLCGIRSSMPDELGGNEKDAAEAWNDLLDAKQLGFAMEDIYELFDDTPPAHQLHTEQPPDGASNGAQLPETAS